ADLEDRLLHNVREEDFRNICQNALEGLASKKLNLAMLVERRAKAQERRLVPETIARFLSETASLAGLTLREFKTLPHTFELDATVPIRFDFYRARVVDGLSHVIHEHLFVVQLQDGQAPMLREPSVLGNLVPGKVPGPLPPIASADEATAWLHENALRPFLEE